MEDVSNDCNAKSMEAEDTLFILYTSVPEIKGIQHSIAGYMVYAEYSFLEMYSNKTKYFIGVRQI